jgi:N-acetyl sugar amidotransferase
MSKNLVTCNRCIMDSSDRDIIFDDHGVCEYCQNFDKVINPIWIENVQNPSKVNILAQQIRAEGKGKDFDCIIGISGGLDSSYAAFVAKEKMGLRPLLLHVDAGWNTDRAVGNIEKLVDGLGLDLFTEVVNWDSIRRMQLAFFRSGIPDQDLVQDAAFFSALYKFARQHKIRYIITGSNYSTECCREPEGWGGYLGIDRTLFNDIWQQHGDGLPNNDFPLIDIIRYKILYQKLLGVRVCHPLNMVPYLKKDAEEELGKRFGWEKFQHKHHESRFTRFYEDYWLPRRFGFDKRKAHFSSLIMTGQMVRQEALSRISKPELDENVLLQEFEYVANKLEISKQTLEMYFNAPKKTYRDYRNKRWVISFGAKSLRLIGSEKRYIK